MSWYTPQLANTMTATAVAQAGCSFTSRAASAVSKKAGMPAPAQASRYPVVNPARRSARQERTERWYMEATGATDGSIIAAIISVHMPTKPARPRPMVPVMPAIARPDPP